MAKTKYGRTNRKETLAATLISAKPAPLPPRAKSPAEIRAEDALDLEPDSDIPESLKPEVSTNYSFARAFTYDEEKKKPYQRTKLYRLMFKQPEVYERLLAVVRVGAFPWVAAASLGFTPHSYYNWMRRGEKEKRTIYAKFYRDVTQAQAQARLTTEIQVRKDNPEFWLRNGPGKSRAGLPGWTEVTMVEQGETPLQVNVGGTVQHQHAHIHIPAVSDPSLGNNTPIPGSKSIKQLTSERANPTLSGVLTILEEIGIANLSKLGKSTRTEEESPPIPVESAPVDPDPEKKRP